MHVLYKILSSPARWVQRTSGQCAICFFLVSILAGIVHPCHGFDTGSAQRHTSAQLAAMGLTEEERQWLRDHPVIRVGSDPDFPPVEWRNEEGRYQGVATDCLALVQQRLPIRFKIIDLKNWSEIMRRVKARRIDMLSAAVPTPERLQYLNFTPPIMKFSAVIITRKDAERVHRLYSLEDMRVAVVANYAASEYMRVTYPGVELVTVPDITSGLRQVSFGKLDAMILNMASATYYIHKEGITNLEVYKDTDFIYDLSLASRSDWPQLNSILSKAVRDIPSAEKQKVLDKWVHLQDRGWQIPRWLVVCMLGTFILTVFIAIIVWNRLLRKQVRLKTQALHYELKERRKTEQEKQQLQQKIHRAKKMEALGLLAGGVAHDLNNILSGIVGYPDLLLQQLADDDPMCNSLKAIKESGKRAADQVGDLLTIARGSALEKRVESLNTIVEQYLASPEHQELMQRHPQVTVHFQPSTEQVDINCSVSHLNKTILNLVFNGVEAIQDSGCLSITTRQEYLSSPFLGYQEIAPGDYAVLGVTDTGVGISQTDLEHIFEPFYSKKKMRRSGTGLGLAIVWNTILDHDGAIDVTSTDQGTAFCLYFPREIGRQKVQQLETAPVESLQGAGQTILVVDDEPQMRDIAVTMLEYLGYIPFSVDSGEEAVRFMAKRGVDLLLLDMIMDPGINGRQAYERILSDHPGQKAIIVSGFSESTDVLYTKAMGAGQFIRKPYTLEILARAVKDELAP